MIKNIVFLLILFSCSKPNPIETSCTIDGKKIILNKSIRNSGYSYTYFEKPEGLKLPYYNDSSLTIYFRFGKIKDYSTDYELYTRSAFDTNVQVTVTYQKTEYFLSLTKNTNRAARVDVGGTKVFSFKNKIFEDRWDTTNIINVGLNIEIKD